MRSYSSKLLMWAFRRKCSGHSNLRCSLSVESMLGSEAGALSGIRDFPRELSEGILLRLGNGYARAAGGCLALYIQLVYTLELEVTLMSTTRIFKSGNSQAVRLPKEFRFQVDEVEIFRRGGEVVLREKAKGLERAFGLLANLPIDVDAIEEARKEQPQKRKGL